MKLLVGLGNPGSQYVKTRHNAGYMVVDQLLDRYAPGAIVRSRFNADCVEAMVAGHKCLLIKPTTYMNRSGQSVLQAVQFYKILPADMLVLTDDLALPVGSIRLRASGSPGGHNGLVDIQNRLGISEFSRCRIGIGPKPPAFDQADFVLSRFLDTEMDMLEAAVKTAADAAEVFVSSGIDSAMNQYNTRLRTGSNTASDNGSGLPEAWPSDKKKE